MDLYNHSPIRLHGVGLIIQAEGLLYLYRGCKIGHHFIGLFTAFNFIGGMATKPLQVNDTNRAQEITSPNIRLYAACVAAAWGTNLL
jgi:hypothetical protein